MSNLGNVLEREFSKKRGSYYKPIRKCERDNKKLVLSKHIPNMFGSFYFRFIIQLYDENESIHKEYYEFALTSFLGYYFYKWRFKFKKLDLLVDAL